MGEKEIINELLKTIDNIIEGNIGEEMSDNTYNFMKKYGHLQFNKMQSNNISYDEMR